ncbi:hypothetical protein HJG60_008174 [Phyllostomus discolor]|uniref:Uncharacterized protein n=1 Tax=Phyllostomus discolor TaxID=89673 RepID=A0A833Z921_9CHIR|nr:hypothetical protein HJG60_008174 [Phyllostomus discolor]
MEGPTRGAALGRESRLREQHKGVMRPILEIGCVSKERPEMHAGGHGGGSHFASNLSARQAEAELAEGMVFVGVISFSELGDIHLRPFNYKCNSQSEGAFSNDGWSWKSRTVLGNVRPILCESFARWGYRQHLPPWEGRWRTCKYQRGATHTGTSLGAE